MIRVKVFMTLDVDPEEYPVPLDNDVATEIEDAFEEYLYDIGGVRIKSMKVLQENRE
jgi:hypothetical protein